jgi:hypothetical protein
MLGINDPWILMAYLLCIFSTVACIGYGIYNWNKGAENDPDEISKEAKWENNESKINELL